jgi:hypothetical protein
MTKIIPDLKFRQAKVEFGEALASTLKLSPDGSTILWPQPADDPNDPQNVRICFISCGEMN